MHEGNHCENSLRNTLPGNQHHHTTSAFCPSDTRPSICLSICFPARTSALGAIFHLPPVGVHDSCPPPSSSIDFCRFSHTHALIGSPLTHFRQSTRQPPSHLSGTHSIGPWGCYVHCWNGHAGFCPPAH